MILLAWQIGQPRGNSCCGRCSRSLFLSLRGRRRV